MRSDGLSPILALRFIALITARYNWAKDEASVGHDELSRLWGVSRRTVLRDMERLQKLGLLVVARPARRGRVATYRLGHDALDALGAMSADRLPPDLHARVRAHVATDAQGDPQPSRHPIPFDTDTDADLWTRLRAASARTLKPATVERWLDPLAPEPAGGDTLVLRAPSRFHADYAERALGDTLRRLAAHEGLNRVAIVA
jgi:DNA-binding transcriptional MocR family regulator